MCRAPISSTRNRVAVSARSTVSGSPISLLNEPYGRDGPSGGGEHLGEQVLGAGLALRPGQRDHAYGGQPAEHVVGQRGQRRDGVVDEHRRGRPVSRVDSTAAAPARDGGVGVVVAVDALAHDRDEQAAALGDPAVDEGGRR